MLIHRAAHADVVAVEQRLPRARPGEPGPSLISYVYDLRFLEPFLRSPGTQQVFY